MAAKPLPCPTVLRLLLRYEPETGHLFWKQRPAWLFVDKTQSAAHNATAWNAKLAGRQALHTKHGNGYASGALFNVKAYAHRVVWAIVHGVWPNTIDHINGARSDNRIVNLRDVTQHENCLNAALSKNNKSGVNGVCYYTRQKKWNAQIVVAGKRISIGNFTSFDDAVAARKAAEVEHGFHINHGRSLGRNFL